jgi:multidrug efflux pump subunit AcrA (membrane-fusion protein)
VKAQFDNAHELMWPGAFVNVRLAARTLKDAIVVPQAAVIRGPRGTLVYAIDAAGKAAARPIVLVYAAGLDAVVTGVQAGERIVVDGRQNLRDGAPVVERAASAGRNGNGAASAASGASGTAAAASSAIAP